ncbi:hypothetical protein CK203_063532 [Vitis vinifera]|uniref:Uncharacterized protein n=1 Tax=Vitis vinifera TaxID=29760 RepID=A0A438G3H7_VITVI|nr:hypothetical protein CK203_063532 [Vitis vinifera]
MGRFNILQFGPFHILSFTWLQTSSTNGVLDSIGLPAKDVRTGCPDAPSDGFVSHGGGRATITLWVADRDRGRPNMRGCHVYPDGVDPDGLRATCQYESPFVWLGHVASRGAGAKKGIYDEPPTLGFGSASGFKKNVCKEETVSSVRASDAREKSIDKLNAKEFRDRAIQRGALVPSSGVVQGIPPFLPDFTRLHPSQHSSGADGMQHYKHVVQSRPLAAGAAGFDEGRNEGTRDGPGSVGGAIGASGETFFSKLLHSASGSGKEGPHS